MNEEEFEAALDEIRDSIPVGDEIDKLTRRCKANGLMEAAFKAGALASSLVVLKKFEEIYNRILENGCT